MVDIKVPVEELRKAKIMVCTPMYGGMCGGMYTKACCDLSTLAAQYQMDLKYFYLFHSPWYPRESLDGIANIFQWESILIY